MLQIPIIARIQETSLPCTPAVKKFPCCHSQASIRCAEISAHRLDRFSFVHPYRCRLLQTNSQTNTHKTRARRALAHKHISPTLPVRWRRLLAPHSSHTRLTSPNPTHTSPSRQSPHHTHPLTSGSHISHHHDHIPPRAPSVSAILTSESERPQAGVLRIGRRRTRQACIYIGRRRTVGPESFRALGFGIHPPSWHIYIFSGEAAEYINIYILRPRNI